MNAHLFLRSIDNPALGARGRLYLAKPEVQEAEITLDDLYQIVRDQYESTGLQAKRFDLLAKIFADFAKSYDLAPDDFAAALNISIDEANALLIGPDARTVQLQQLWAQTVSVSQSMVLRDALQVAAGALANNMREIGASAAELAAANGIAVDAVNELLNIAQQAEAARLAEQQAQQATQQAAEVISMDETLDLERVMRESQVLFNNEVKAIRNKIAEIATARATGQSYALPVWSVDYPLIPADLVESLLAQYQLPTIAELEAELAASQAAATGVDVSRGIDATSVVTAPAAPSDTTAPVVTAPVVTAPVVTAPVVTAPVVTAPLIALPDDWDTYSDTRKIAWFNANQIKPSQLISAGVPASDIAYMRANGYTVQEQAPAAGGGYALLLALASAYFLGA